MSIEFPTTGPLLGVDFGTKRVGLALCDSEQKVASPLALYVRRTLEADGAFFKAEVRKHGAVGLVVGLPLHLHSGDEGKLAKQARKFGQWLGENLCLPVVYVDERLTSAQADELLTAAGLRGKARQTRLDQLAAQILLQTYLDVANQSGGRWAADQGPIVGPLP